MGKRKTREARMLREARLRMGYSQQEVANIIGVHIKQYQRLEYGKRDIRNCSMKTGLDIHSSIMALGPAPPRNRERSALRRRG